MGSAPRVQQCSWLSEEEEDLQRKQKEQPAAQEAWEGAVTWKPGAVGSVR